MSRMAGGSGWPESSDPEMIEWAPVSLGETVDKRRMIPSQRTLTEDLTFCRA